MSDALPPNVDLYDVLKVDPSATDREIQRAYRKRAVVLHPDKNKSPTAEDDFHVLKLALEILISPTTRAAYDALRKAKAAKAERTARYDDKRRQMQRDLEEAERESSNKRRRMDGERANVEDEERAFHLELAKLREESERLKAERDRKLREELVKQDAERPQQENEGDVEEEGRRTVKIKFRSGVDRETLTAELLGQAFSRFGEVENVLLRKSALVVFQNAEAAQDAVSRILVNDDPVFSQIKLVTLVSPVAPSNGVPLSTGATKNEEPRIHKSPVDAQPLRTTKFSFKTPTTLATGGADYERITLMRMRKLEKEKLEREIRDQEARQDMETNLS
jgi:DnaJ family protein C protein 17